MTNQAVSPSTDEGLMSAIAHFFGLLVALIVWAAQKDKSRYVRFQSIQAVAFDLCVSIVMFLFVAFMMLLVIIVLGLGVGDIAIFGTQGNPAAEPIRTLVGLMTALPFLAACTILPMGVLIFVARLVASIQTLQGKNFHYPWLGNWVERMLARS